MSQYSVMAAFHEGDDTPLALVIHPVCSCPGCAFVVGEKDRGIGVRGGQRHRKCILRVDQHELPLSNHIMLEHM